MTYREKLKKDHPDYVNEKFTGGCCGCPYNYYKNTKIPKGCSLGTERENKELCLECWNQEMEDEE